MGLEYAKVEDVYCCRCGSNSHFNPQYLMYDVYFCQKEIGYHEYCLGVRAKCDYCGYVCNEKEFSTDENGIVRHEECGHECLGLTKKLYFKKIMERNIRQGYMPVGCRDLVDFMAQNDLHFIDLNMR